MSILAQMYTWSFTMRTCNEKNKKWNKNISPLPCGGQITIKQWRNISISKSKSQNQCIFQVWWKSTDIYFSYRLETKIQTDGRLTDWLTDGQTDGRTHGRPTWNIIPRHYRVARYKITRYSRISIAQTSTARLWLTRTSFFSPTKFFR